MPCFAGSLLREAGRSKIQPMAQDSLLRDASPEEVEAFVQTVVMVAYADGDLSDPEAKLLVERIGALSEGRASESRVLELMEELPPLSRADSNWRAARIQSLKTELKSEDLKRGAFSLAVEVAQVDSGMGVRETRLLLNIVNELGIDPTFAQNVIRGNLS